MCSTEQPQVLAPLHLFSVTNNEDARNMLVLSLGLPRLSSFRCSPPIDWFPSCSACSSANAYQPWAAPAVYPSAPPAAALTPAIHHLELRLEVRCKRWGYVHPAYLSCHTLLSWAVRWQSCNNLHHWWSELDSTCHLQTALKIKRSTVS